jgi:hypothetical protein
MEIVFGGHMYNNMHDKFIDLTVNTPTTPIFDPLAQKIVAIGVVIFLIMWGISKIYRR